MVFLCLGPFRVIFEDNSGGGVIDGGPVRTKGQDGHPHLCFAVRGVFLKKRAHTIISRDGIDKDPLRGREGRGAQNKW